MSLARVLVFARGSIRSASVKAQFMAGLALLAALMLPPLRPALESSMSLHMLAQYPTLLLAGALLSAAVQQRVRRPLATCNTLGISGLAACALVLAVLMIPRVLDLALVDLRVEAAKVAALLFAGAVLQPSWRAAGLVVQGFFLGNLLPMMAIVGTIYQDSPLRLCNAYRLDDQQHLGQGLVGIAIVVALGWLVQVGRRLAAPPAAAQRSVET
jgi:ABC-type Fe3+-siderophore transport system permease subunit